jgi:hypothetical protein
MTVHNDRLTVPPNQRFTVFLIGMRVNKWWLAPISFVVARAMFRMMRELSSKPDSPLLAFESYGGRTTLMVQYWRSKEDLLDYARSKEGQHVPAWRDWIKKWALGGAVGIWHETYDIEPGKYESVYHHMPAFGLGKVGPLIPAEGQLKTAAGRLAAGAASLDRKREQIAAA